MNVIPLGAGQEVGRSCVIVTINNKTIMFDCGMHMGYSDSRKFPDFSYLSSTNSFDKVLDCIIISHFHLDHCGSLPYFTEVLGYKGPIYMTYPTRAVLPILLEDCRKILHMKSKDNKMYTTEDIKNCIEKIIPLNMNETFEVEENFIITPYYAGHVIGAAMFYVKVGNRSVVYTGDYSTVADKHLGTAWIDCLKPDLMITESTYGSVVRDCRKSKERDFLQSIHLCIKEGGKVLIPIFALGRAQELCLLIDAYWERMGLDAPIYFAGGLTEKANEIYKRFINYTNDNIKKKIFERNVFEFDNIKQYTKNAELEEGPCVIFSSPAMLHSGLSLKIFKNICEDPKSLVILPGYCVRGTIGDKVLNGVKKINILGEEKNININVKNLAFSAHADTMGIMKMIDQCKPKAIMLVHGEKTRMDILKKNIKKEFNLPVYMPSNGTMIDIPTNSIAEVLIEKEVLKNLINLNEASQEINLAMKISKTSNGVEIVDCKEFLIDKNKPGKKKDES
jgi:integrator complex subunit 11